jgi:hypothetical protein
MVWRGVVIEESLEDKTLLKLVKIVKTKESKLEGEEGKGVRHFHSVDVANKDLDDFTKKAKKAIKPKWWIHVVNGNEMWIILRGKMFRHRRGDAASLKEIRDYAASWGIMQLPDETLMDRPYD